ncbi:hypothetical protein JCM8547_004722 [Rhodosporidiobolus lusitaniae]
MERKEPVRTGVEWYPTKEYSVLPGGSFQKDVLDPSFYAHSPKTGKLVAPLDPSKPFVVYHRDFLKIVGQNPSFEIIASNEVSEGGDGYPLFHEAGIWIEETKEVVFTSNCNPQFHNHIGRIRLDALSSRPLNASWDLLPPVPLSGTSPSVTATNGGTLLRLDGTDKLLLCCQGTSDIPSNLSIMDPQSGESYPLLNNFHGRPFNALNDVVVLPPPAKKGGEVNGTWRTDLHDDERTTIWFTDPTYASAQGYKGAPQLPNQVYCFTPSTGDIRVVADGFVMPNGICFSPCGTLCYITDTGMISGDGNIHPQRPGTVYVYDVVRPEADNEDWTAAGPRLENRRVFAFVDAGIPDGIKTDREGNVYSGTGEGVTCWNRYGTLLGKIVLFPSSLPSSLLSTGLSTRSEEHKVRFCANFNFCPDGKMCILAEDRIYVAGLSKEVKGALLP